MRKKVLAIFLSLCMVFTLVPSMSVFAYQGSQDKSIKGDENISGEPESSDAYLSAEVNFDDVVFLVKADSTAGLSGDVNVKFSGNSGTLYLPGSADTTKLYLSCETAEGAAAEDMTVQVNSNTYLNGEAPLPAAGETLSYTAVSGSSSKTFTVKTMKGSVGVEGMFMKIDESRGTIEAMNTDKTHETLCYGSMGFKSEKYYISMKGRGNWTWVQGNGTLNDKKPYNITLYKNEACTEKKKGELIDGVKIKKWSLLANYADGSLMHNKIAYDLACKLGIGMKSRYVDIWMNGEYIGNYLLTPKNDYDAPDDGFALELDNNFDTEDPYFALDGLVATGTSENVFTVKNVGDNAKEAGLTTQDIQNWMQTMLNAVMDTKSEDYTKYIDIDSWAKFYLIHEFCKSIDSLCGSQLMHRDGLTENDKLIAGPVWDMDVAFGHVFNNGKYGISSYTQSSADGWIIDSIDGSTSFLQYLGKHESFMKRVYEIYNDYSYAFDEIVTEIETLTDLLEDSAALNYNVWNVKQTQYNATYVYYANTRGSGTYAYSLAATGSWSDYVKNFKAYVSKRLSYFNDNMKVVQPSGGTVTGEISLSLGDAVSLTADCTADKYQWQVSSDGEEWQDISGATFAVYSTTAKFDMDGKYYRCLVSNLGNVINTTRVAKTNARATVALEPVKLTVSSEGHNHSCTEEVISPTCKEKGYSKHTCACGYTYNDNETDFAAHDFVKGKCTVCGAEDPNYVVKCEGRQSKSLEEGKLIFSIGGNEAGEFDFAKSGNGWTIQSNEKGYLSFANESFNYSTQPFVWNYSNGVFTTSVTKTTTTTRNNDGIMGWFSRLFGGNRQQTTTTTTTYYLRYSSGNFSVSTSSGGTSAFAVEISSDQHSFGSRTDNKNGTHSRTCSVCKETETEDCDYGKNDICEYCGAQKPGAGSIDIKVDVTSQTTTQRAGGLFGWLFGRTTSTTTYTATITATPYNTTVQKVEYSTDNRNWITGTSYSSSSSINTLYVKVLGGNGVTYEYTYRK